MSTTTIRLTEDLKTRVAKAAENAGKTPHALILDAIAEKVGEEERRNEFYDTASQRFAQIVASGESVPWDKMRSYLEQRLNSKKPNRPSPRKITT